MVSLMLVSLSGNERGKSYIFDKEAVLIGTDDSCDLRIPPSDSDLGGLPQVIAEILRRPDGFRLTRLDSGKFGISINNNPITKMPIGDTVELQDGDLIGFQRNTKESRYSLHVIEDRSLIPATKLNGKKDPPPQEHMFPEVDVVGHIHPLTATRFLKGLVSGLWHEVPKPFRLLLSVVLASSFCAFIFSMLFLIYTVRQTTDAVNNINNQRNLYEKKIEQQKRQIDQLQEALKKENNRINSAQNISETFQSGVCLIQGVYTYINASTGSQLRYLDSTFNNRALIDERGELNVSFIGTGAVFYESFSGTGFLVKEGTVLTNRHVVHPWWKDDTDRLIILQGGRPQLVELYAYFPSIKRRFELKVDLFSNQHDVAYCTFEQGDSAIPELPTDATNQGAAVGQPIVVIGYPTGIDGLIERLDDKLKSEIERSASSPEDRTKEVAERGLIHPLTTQGHINGLNAGRIIHDAATTDGGSGSPIFNNEGNVIGINASILANDRGVPVQGSNLGIPIRFALELQKSK